MTNMWEALERYQPFAERHGFGAEWRRMTTERTEEAARAAWAAGVMRAAAAGVMRAAAAAARAAEAEAWEARAIQHINEAIKREDSE